MRLHWFSNKAHGLSLNELRSMVTELDGVGYSSFLLPYVSERPDLFLKAAHILEENQSIKLMSAIRPRSLSPEYCAMQAAAFNEIYPNRLMLNVLHGTMVEGETGRGIIDYENTFSTRRGTIEHTRLFLKKLRDISIFNSSNIELFVPGSMADTIEIAVEYGDCVATDYHSLRGDPSRFGDANRLMVTLDMAIKDKTSGLDDSGEDNLNLIYIPEDNLVEFVKSLKEWGVTDIMVSSPTEAEDPSPVHNAIKKYLAEIVAI